MSLKQREARRKAVDVSKLLGDMSLGAVVNDAIGVLFARDGMSRE